MKTIFISLFIVCCVKCYCESMYSKLDASTAISVFITLKSKSEIEICVRNTSDKIIKGYVSMEVFVNREWKEFVLDVTKPLSKSAKLCSIKNDGKAYYIKIKRKKILELMPPNTILIRSRLNFYDDIAKKEREVCSKELNISLKR